MILPGQSPLWLGTALVLALGVCVVVGGAAVGTRLTRAVVWQRAFWRASILGLLALLAAEATGISGGIAQWWQVRGASSRGSQSLVAKSADRPADPLRQAAGDVLSSAHLATSATETTSLSSRTDVDEPLAPPLLASALDARLPATPAGQGVTAGEVDALWCPTTRRGPQTADARSVTAASPTASGSDCWGPGLTSVWLLGAAILLARMAWSRWRLQRFRRRLVRVEQAGVRQRVDRLAGRLGVRRRVEVLASPRLAAPIAFGFWRPVIVLPAGFAEDFDACQQDAMLAHELAHLAAADPLWQLLADLAAVLFWWHPLVWWARRRERAAGELAADEASLLVPHGADTLAACLVMLARRLESRPRLAWLAMAGPGLRSALARRVERLLDLSVRTWQPPTRGRLRIVTATVPVALLVVAVSCTAWARTRVPRAEGGTAMKVFVDGWRQSLAAVALVAVFGPASGDAARTVAAEGERDVPLVKAKPEGGDRPAAKPEREGERREARREEERKPEARGEREREGGAEREARAREMAQRRAHLQEEAMAIRRKLEALKPDQEGARQELRAALERIEVQLRELQAQAPDRERVRARLEELKAAHRQAREAGRADEAERLEREARELMQMLEQRPGDRPPGRPEGEELQRRMQHLRAAIENLHAAGLHDQAEMLARSAERLARGERPAPPEGGRRPDAPRDMPPGAPQLERAVQELRGQVQELRQQMEEIRQHLKALAEKR